MDSLVVNTKLVEFDIMFITSIDDIENMGWDLSEYYNEAEDILAEKERVDQEYTVILELEGTPDEPKVYYHLLNNSTNENSQRQESGNDPQSLIDIIEMLGNGTIEVRDDSSVCEIGNYIETFVENVPEKILAHIERNQVEYDQDQGYKTKIKTIIKDMGFKNQRAFAENFLGLKWETLKGYLANKRPTPDCIKFTVKTWEFKQANNKISI